MIAGIIKKHTELEVYQTAFAAASEIFRLSKEFPREEMYSLTDQIRRSSRSVTANLAEAWRKRRYEAAFVAKLSDAESEAAETQCWLQHAVACEYVDREKAKSLYEEYDAILAKIVRMITNAKQWTIKPKQS